MDDAFRLVLTLLAVVLVGTPLALLAHRVARRRWADSHSSASVTGV